MKVDVSELKAFRHCKRSWQLSSRNQFHLTSFVLPGAFILGTVFHNSLHKMYLGKSLEEVKEFIEQSEVDESDKIMLTSMARGYYTNTLPDDIKRFEVKNIEWHFEIPVKKMCVCLGIPEDIIESCQDVILCGSIDMVCVDRQTGEVWGFEHKTAKNFRNDVYCWMDEQPRLYYAALKFYVDSLNTECHDKFYRLGGVYINEVRKLVRAYDTRRTALMYPDDDLRNFMYGLLTSVAECHKMVNDSRIPRVPQPDFRTCSMCMYNTICQEYMYKDLSLGTILGEFSQEFEVRENDHLEEKEEV